jgi:hypothetical protein
MSGDGKVEVSKGGLALAQHIAPVYGDNPKVRVVMAAGSAARGCADQYANLEKGSSSWRYATCTTSAPR